MMDLAAEPATSPSARAAVRARLTRLRGALAARRSADPAEEAHARLAEQDLTEFLAKPESRKPRGTRLEVPPGRPIGQ